MADNRVKHALAAKASDGPFSSFQRCVRRGWYVAEWAGPEHRPETEYTEPW